MGMVDEPPPPGPPTFDPLPGWPSPPDGADPGPSGPAERGARPSGPAEPGLTPSAAQPGWLASRPPWAELPSGAGAVAPPAAPARGQGLAALRRPRTLAILAGVIVLLLIAALAVIVVGDDGGDGAGSDGSRTGGSRQSAVPSLSAPPPAPGQDIPLLEGRLVVIARPGWEALESSTDTASVRLVLDEPGRRQLLTTLIVIALPGAGTLERTLARDGGTRFDVETRGGPVQATAVPGPAAQVVAGVVRADVAFVVSLSIVAEDGTDLDVALLMKLFTEQVAPQLRFS